MSVIYENKYDVQARVRRRRRKIAGTRRILISRRARSVLVITSICLITMFGGYLVVKDNSVGDVGLSSGAFASEKTIYETITVYEGDTIWGIASEYTDPSQDIRKQVRDICELNDITSGKIYPGQTILLPIV